MCHIQLPIRRNSFARQAAASRITDEKVNPFLISAYFPSRARPCNLIASGVQSRKTFSSGGS